MFVLHADIVKPNVEFLNGIREIKNVEYKHLSNTLDIIEFMDKNDVLLLVVGEKLENNSGLELINIISGYHNYKIPIIYIVDNKDDYHLDHYTTIGVRDCVLRSNLTFAKIQSYLKVLSNQAQIAKNMASLSVAVIDDSELSLKVVKSILHEENITNVKLFSDPVVLLKDYKYFDLYFVDIVMPSITGDKLIPMLRRLSPKSIIIAMSTVDNVTTISNVLSAGADDYIVKPFNKVELLARIRTNYRSFLLLKELEEKNNELDRLSKTDSLTGAFNHGHLFNTIEKEVIRANGSGNPLSLLLLDLDKFKAVNDSYGHGIGDEVLKSLSALFINECTETDFFGRYGGEEFIFLMANTQIDRAIVISNKLKDTFTKMKIKGMPEKVTFSGGITQWNGVESYDEFIKRADDLLYLAKSSGRNKIIQ